MNNGILFVHGCHAIRTVAPSLGWSGLETDGVTGKDRPASTRRPAGPAPETLHMQANGNFMPPPARGALRTTLALVYADLTPSLVLGDFIAPSW